MTGELFKGVTSDKGIASLLIAWGVPVALVMGVWWLLAYDTWTTVILPPEAVARIEETQLPGVWLFFIVWAALTLALGLNAQLFFRLYEGYLAPQGYASRRKRIHWLRRESARLEDRLAVATTRLDADGRVPAGTPTIASMEADKAVIDASLHAKLGWLGRDLARLPFRTTLNWRDYPTTEADMLPTLLGNRIRAFERYGNARYGLDLLVLWYEFVGVAGERVNDEVASARMAVEINLAGSVCFAGLSFSNLIPLMWAQTWRGAWWLLPITAAASAAVSAVAYRRAVGETDGWAYAVSSLVNMHRAKVAAAFGFALPDTLEDERRMWRAVFGFVRTGSDGWAKRFDALQRLPQKPDGNTP